MQLAGKRRNLAPYNFDVEFSERGRRSRDHLPECLVVQGVACWIKNRIGALSCVCILRCFTAQVSCGKGFREFNYPYLINAATDRIPFAASTAAFPFLVVSRSPGVTSDNCKVFKEF